MEEKKYDLPEAFCLAIIQLLLKSGEINEDIDTMALSEIVMEKARDNEFVKTIPAAYTISDKFYEAIIDEIEKERFNVGICLSGIYIELITNEFLQSILQDHLWFSNKDFEDCMKSLTVESKITWLLKLVTSKVIDPELVSKVRKLNSLRNKVIHFKPRTENFSNVFSSDEEELEEIEVLQIINDLKKTYTKIFTELYPQYEIGKRLLDKLKSE